MRSRLKLSRAQVILDDQIRCEINLVEHGQILKRFQRVCLDVQPFDVAFRAKDLRLCVLDGCDDAAAFHVPMLLITSQPPQRHQTYGAKHQFSSVSTGSDAPSKYASAPACRGMTGDPEPVVATLGNSSRFSSRVLVTT